MYRLYDFPRSGNCYKVRLLLNQLEIPFERVEINLLEQQTRSPEFLQKNLNGKLPLLEIETDVFLAESNAIK
jgi:glutathione S-transferase